MKSYTDLEQSKKLAKILPLESADMCYGIDDDTLKYNDLPWLIPYYKYTAKEYYIPCWSLAALLSVLRSPSLHITFMGWRCDFYNKESTSCIFGEPSNNPIDTCVEMVIKLKLMNLL